MMLGQSVPGITPAFDDPLYKRNYILLRQSAIFADLITGVIRDAWVEQDSTNQWSSVLDQGNTWRPIEATSSWRDIDVADLPVVRGAE